MATVDLVDNVDVAQSLLPAARSSGTGTGATVDLSGYDSAFVEFSFGAVTDGTHTPSVMHSVDSTTWTDAGTDGALWYPPSLITGTTGGTFTGALNPVTAAGGTSGNGGNQGTSVQRVGYKGTNRYVRAMLAVTSGTTGGVSAANVLRGHPRLAALA